MIRELYKPFVVGSVMTPKEGGGGYELPPFSLVE